MVAVKPEHGRDRQCTAPHKEEVLTWLQAPRMMAAIREMFLVVCSNTPSCVMIKSAQQPELLPDQARTLHVTLT